MQSSVAALGGRAGFDTLTLRVPSIKTRTQNRNFAFTHPNQGHDSFEINKYILYYIYNFIGKLQGEGRDIEICLLLHSSAGPG